MTPPGFLAPSPPLPTIEELRRTLAMIEGVAVPRPGKPKLTVIDGGRRDDVRQARNGRSSKNP